MVHSAPAAPVAAAAVEQKGAGPEAEDALPHLRTPGTLLGIFVREVAEFMVYGAAHGPGPCALRTYKSREALVRANRCLCHAGDDLPLLEVGRPLAEIRGIWPACPFVDVAPGLSAAALIDAKTPLQPFAIFALGYRVSADTVVDTGFAVPTGSEIGHLLLAFDERKLAWLPELRVAKDSSANGAGSRRDILKWIEYMEHTWVVPQDPRGHSVWYHIDLHQGPTSNVLLYHRTRCSARDLVSLQQLAPNLWADKPENAHGLFLTVTDHGLCSTRGIWLPAGEMEQATAAADLASKSRDNAAVGAAPPATP